jgi:glycerol-3-phosphate dehydrogenase (NAD(P)+)
MFDRISIIGSGSWGSALAVALSDHGLPVTLWSHNPAVAEEINSRRTNASYLPRIEIPSAVRATPDLADTLSASLIVFVVPSKAVRKIATDLAELGPKPGSVVVSCTKGIEHDSGKLMSQVLADCLPGCRMAVLSGPNLALEIARRVPSASVIGSDQPDLLAPLQRVFSVKNFRAYTSEDILGIQLGGALKNVYAIAAGVCDGFGMGDNSKAALVTRSLAEMTRLGVSLGGRKETFFGLSGVGDLMVTCFSAQSRNRKFGERLGRGDSPAAIIDSMQMVAEGVPTALGAWQCAQRAGIDAPITAEIYSVLHQGKPPRESMSELLGRPPKPENDIRGARPE